MPIMITFTKVCFALNLVILVGDTDVGKTNIVSRYIHGKLPKNSFPTIGVEFTTRNVPLKFGGIVKAQIWDTAGQECYVSITKAHYRRSKGAIIVYDITKAITFDHINRWLSILKDNAESNLVIMIVGNKLDIVTKNPSKREVTRERAESFAKNNGFLFDEVSALSNIKIKESFEYLLETIYETQSKLDSQNEPTGVSLSMQEKNVLEPKTCCV